jgi:hypothetical protein
MTRKLFGTDGSEVANADPMTRRGGHANRQGHRPSFREETGQHHCGGQRHPTVGYMLETAIASHLLHGADVMLVGLCPPRISFDTTSMGQCRCGFRPLIIPITITASGILPGWVQTARRHGT